MSNTHQQHPASFRDPSGFVYFYQDILLRQINKSYQSDYDKLIDSGLYQKLVDQKLLIPHQESNLKPLDEKLAYKIIQPDKIQFISYPYEWCFSQLKDAALTTLRIQKLALDYNFTLKDASAYNIQFLNNFPILIDTLSFEKYQTGSPWVAYRQFCQHFLAPLSLMSLVDIKLNQLLRTNIDGIPLSLTSHLLPKTSYRKLSLLSHIHLHAWSQTKYSKKFTQTDIKKISLSNLKILIDNLETAIKKLIWQPQNTEWANYYQETNYSNQAFYDKKLTITNWLKKINTEVNTVWDLGGNLGEFSRLAANLGKFTICFDIDPAAVEKNYLQTLTNKETNLLPLLIDLTNPSPALGWSNTERESLFKRGPADLIIALALIHHLALSNNVPLDKIAEFFSQLGPWLIIEFVPITDTNAKKLIIGREKLFNSYNSDYFEKIFSKYYKIMEIISLSNSKRKLYLMKKHAE